MNYYELYTNKIRRTNIIANASEQLLNALDELNAITETYNDVKRQYEKAKRKYDKMLQRHIDKCMSKAEYREKTEYEKANNSLYIEITEIRCRNTKTIKTKSGKIIAIDREFEIYGNVIPEYIDRFAQERELPWRDQRNVILYFDCREQYVELPSGEQKIEYKKDFHYLKSFLKEQKYTKEAITLKDALQRVIGQKVYLSYKYVIYDSEYDR